MEIYMNDKIPSYLLERLCLWDSRHPDYDLMSDAYSSLYLKIPEKQSQNCNCETCQSGISEYASQIVNSISARN